MRLAASRLVVLSVVSLLAACDGTPTSAPRDRSGGAAAAQIISTQSTLGDEIVALVNSGFPKGQATAILADWNSVLRELGREPKTTLKGKTVPGSNGRSALTRTLAYLKLKTGDATPPAGESKDHFVARLALDMSTYAYGGANSSVPPMTPASDVVFDVVQPAPTPDTVVTPAKQAAVVFPPSAVDEPTVIVIAPDTGYYPANCTGPLDTHLCQYPRFYHYNVFPDVKLNSPARVQVCHVDAGSSRLPLADHDRFRLAHAKPANPADYSAGSTIVDNVEILALATMFVTDCQANGGTTYSSASAWRRGLRLLGSLFVPKDAYAIDVGGGGFSEEFSPFAVVDPQSKADLAQTPSGPNHFHSPTSSTTPGGVISIAPWTITNLGSGTSGAFTSDLVVASDAALTNIISTVPLGGQSSLVPQATYGYAGLNVTMPTTPGTYYVATRITPVGADSTASDDVASSAITVSGAPDIAIQGFSVSNPTVYQGGALSLSAFNVANIGNAAANNFSVRMATASDAALQSVIDWPLVAGPVSLAANTTSTYPASSLPISPCMSPGNYFIGPRLQASVDQNPANDYMSVPFTVQIAAAPTGQSPGSAPWSHAGPGNTNSVTYPHCAILTYSYTDPTYSLQTWTYTTTAVATGTKTFSWSWVGLHSWFQVTYQLEAFAMTANNTEITVPLVNTSCPQSCGDFSFSGTVTVPLEAGQQWGIRAKGSNYDSSQLLLGTIRIFEP